MTKRDVLKISMIFILSACSPLISLFDETAYKNGVDLKVDFLFLIDSSSQPYDENQDEIKDFLKKLHKAYEYEKGRDKNNITVKQYKILVSDEGPIYGFLKVWKENNQASEFFRTEVKEQSAQIFDELLKLELAKRKEGIKLRLTDPNSNQSND